MVKSFSTRGTEEELEVIDPIISGWRYKKIFRKLTLALLVTKLFTDVLHSLQILTQQYFDTDSFTANSVATVIV